MAGTGRVNFCGKMAENGVPVKAALLLVFAVYCPFRMT
jgi:hypothetical protein